MILYGNDKTEQNDETWNVSFIVIMGKFQHIFSNIFFLFLNFRTSHCFETMFVSNPIFCNDTKIAKHGVDINKTTSFTESRVFIQGISSQTVISNLTLRESRREREIFLVIYGTYLFSRNRKHILIS